MSRRQTPRPFNMPLPSIWLMTDLRFGTDLLPAIKRLPARSGVIFRHYHLDDKARLTLFRQVRRICRRRGHMLLLAGDKRPEWWWHADGIHARDQRRQSIRMIHSAPVHNKCELKRARRLGVDMVLISPVFATASHPGTKPRGRSGFLALARQASDINVIALGGMTARKAMTLDKRSAHGWAAIDAFKL